MAGEEHYCDGRRHNLTALPGWELQRQRGKRFKSCTQNSKYYYTFYFHMCNCLFHDDFVFSFCFYLIGGVRDEWHFQTWFFFSSFLCVSMCSSPHAHTQCSTSVTSPLSVMSAPYASFLTTVFWSCMQIWSLCSVLNVLFLVACVTNSLKAYNRSYWMSSVPLLASSSLTIWSLF